MIFNSETMDFDRYDNKNLTIIFLEATVKYLERNNKLINGNNCTLDDLETTINKLIDIALRHKYMSKKRAVNFLNFLGEHLKKFSLENGCDNFKFSIKITD